MGTITPVARGFLRAALAGPVASVNAVQQMATWTAPNDGNIHEVMCFVTLNVVSAITGGALTLTATMPNGALLNGANILTGGKTANTTGNLTCHVQAGSTVTISWGAVSVGSGFAYASIWAV